MKTLISKIISVVDYYEEIASIFSKVKPDPAQYFSPVFELPKLTEQMREYLACGIMSLDDLGNYEGKNLYFLNLMKNPATQTTKTIPSLLMVARAINHIQTTGEKILIVTPSSGNKAIALRDAVERAITYKLVTPEQLRIITLTPESSSYKLRESGFTRDEKNFLLNPVCIFASENSEDVKNIAKDFVDKFSEDLHNKMGIRVWYTLDINNYKFADALRAFLCHDALNDKELAHAHAVSSAYGLLGFDTGYKILKEKGAISAIPHYFLIQHLQTHAMVQNIIEEKELKTPTYTWNESLNIFEQSTNPYYPARTEKVDECIDPTFYTRNPNTNEAMGGIIKENGGSGVVISKYECLEKYQTIKELLKRIDITLPEDVNDIKEWSLIMVMTGVLIGIERNLIQGKDVVVHGSGFYSKGDYQELGKEKFSYIKNSEDMYSLLAGK